MRTLLATVLTTCCFYLTLTIDAANEPVKKAAVREIDPKDRLHQLPPGKFDKPIVVTSADQLEKKVVLCKKGGGADLLIQLRKDVDFDKEQLLFFEWSGPADDKLTFQILNCPKRGNPVSFQYHRGTTQGRRSHFRLVVVPKHTPWSVADKNNRPK